jgi:hypothetical protein
VDRAEPKIDPCPGASCNLQKTQAIFRPRDQLSHAHGLGLRHAFPDRRNAIATAALVVQVGVGPLFGFFDQPLLRILSMEP